MPGSCTLLLQFTEAVCVLVTVTVKLVHATRTSRVILRVRVSYRFCSSIRYSMLACSPPHALSKNTECVYTMAKHEDCGTPERVATRFRCLRLQFRRSVNTSSFEGAQHYEHASSINSLLPSTACICLTILRALCIAFRISLPSSFVCFPEISKRNSNPDDEECHALLHIEQDRCEKRKNEIHHILGIQCYNGVSHRNSKLE